MNLIDLKANGECPEWMTEPGFKTLQGGYLQKGETPKGMYVRLAETAGKYLERPDLTERFFEILWKGYLCPATPVASSFGGGNSLPVSCNSIDIGDSLVDIFDKVKELALLTKYGAGLGVYLGRLRPRGRFIEGTGGHTEGVVPFCKVLDSAIYAVAQSGYRRGNCAVYLPIEHPDFLEWLGIRKTTGDTNTRCFNLHQGVVIKDYWMEEMLAGDEEKRVLWRKLLETRAATGEPYITFIDAINRNNPDCYKQKGLEVVTSNLCNECVLFTDPDHTFVCCLSSINLVHWDRIKETDTVELSIMFLDAVMSEYIEKASKIPGLENAVRSAIKGRAVGLGVLGWHTYLQQNFIPFGSFEAMKRNNEIFKVIKEKSDKANKDLAEAYGSPEWCEGHGIRQTHCILLAPTRSNSVISGGYSMGIEPLHFNLMVTKTAKGVFFEKNEVFFDYIKDKHPEQNEEEVVKELIKSSGSVCEFPWLSPEAKEVFKTAREINQFDIIKQAGQRQRYISQGQSVNLFFNSESLPSYINQVHIEAWRQGMKGLYYFRSTSAAKGDVASFSSEECGACEG